MTPEGNAPVLANGVEIGQWHFAATKREGTTPPARGRAPLASQARAAAKAAVERAADATQRNPSSTSGASDVRR